MEDTIRFGKRQVTTREYFTSGHRACQGCGEALAVRLVCKMFGENTIIANATGCMDVVSSQFPYTAWSVPWIHTPVREHGRRGERHRVRPESDEAQGARARSRTFR